MISDADFNNDMWLGPGIWVPPGVADYLISRTQWIREGEKADFQVGVPKGYEFDDLATLAYLIVTNDVVAAKELAENLPRSHMWMEPSLSRILEGNENYTLKNPFKRRRGKQRRGIGKSCSVEKDLLSDDEGDGNKDFEDSTHDDGDDSKKADDGDGDDGNSSKGGGGSTSQGGDSSVPRQDPPGGDSNANQDLLHGDGGDVSKYVDERTSDDENISKDNGDSDDDGSKDADYNDVSKGDGVSGAGGKSEGKRVHKSKTTKTKRKEQFSRIIIPTLDRSAKV